MNLKPSAIKLLRQAKDAILAQPELYDQERFPEAEYEDKQYKTVDCNAPSCIAGWVAWAKFGPKEYVKYVKNCGQVSNENLAKLLSITDEEAEHLYKYDFKIINIFVRTEIIPENNQVAAYLAAARIESFIANDGFKTII